MPNIKSAKKRVLVNQKKNEENKMIKTQVKTAIKNETKYIQLYIELLCFANIASGTSTNFIAP